MKLSACILAAVVSSLFVNVPKPNFSIPDPTEQFYVNDYADVLSDEEEAELVEEGQLLYDLTTSQVVLLTVDSTGSKEISDYAIETFQKWGIGSNTSDNGILIVLAADDREVWVTVGYGLEGDLPDAKVGRMIDTYAVPYYKDDEFAKGSKQLYYALDNEVRQVYEQPIVGELDNNVEKERVKIPSVTMTDIMFFLLKLFYLYVCLSGTIFFMIILRVLLTYLSMRFSANSTTKENSKKYFQDYMTRERVWELFKYAFFGVYAETIRSGFGGNRHKNRHGGGSSSSNRHTYTGSHTHHNSGGNSGGGGATGGGGAGRSF